MVYTSIEACLSLEQKSYLFVPTNDSVTRIVLPNSSLTIFETRFEEHEGEEAIDHARKQLAPITLNVEFHGIYDNKMAIYAGRKY